MAKNPDHLKNSVNVPSVSLFLLTVGLILFVIRRKKSKLPLEEKSEKCKKLDDYSFRQLFHFFINSEFHYDKIHLAKEFSERAHQEASEYMLKDHEDNPDFPDHFTYYPYDKIQTKERLDYIQQRLFKEKYLDWCDAGQPVSSNSRYWWAKTQMRLTTYLIQREPYHLTDGAWLRGVQQGPMSSIQAKLFAIYIDEMGNGDERQNHPNVYLDVLKSLGLQIPPVTSTQFIEQESILEISFKKPLLTLTTSLFPNTFLPEILGYTLWLETTSPSEHAPLRKILERYDLNPQFSLLHAAIDNNVNGHGKAARDAVDLYLDHIRKTEGEQAVEHYWKRIWTGYVAYGAIGNIDNHLQKLFEEQEKKTPEEEFIELIKRKASFAQKMHGSRRIGPQQYLLNEMFASGDAKKLCHELANSDLVVKGEPGKSKLLNHAVSFHGPMYQVFNADELGIITRWIFSLSPSTVNNILSLIIQRKKLGQKIKSTIKLKLPDQSEKLLRDLFEEKPADLLAAFRASQWTMPANGEKLSEDNVDRTKLIQEIEEGGVLQHVFYSDTNDKQIIQDWLLDGAPLPDETVQTENNEKNHLEINANQVFKFQY